jgi:hypothetical protein
MALGAHLLKCSIHLKERTCLDHCDFNPQRASGGLNVRNCARVEWLVRVP